MKGAEANICSSDVSQMDSESLGQYLASAMVGILSKVEALRPYYEELWRRFDALKDGETICGCETRTEYCQKVLHRSMRSVQYVLYGRPEQPAIEEPPNPSETLAPSFRKSSVEQLAAEVADMRKRVYKITTELNEIENDEQLIEVAESLNIMAEEMSKCARHIEDRIREAATAAA